MEIGFIGLGSMGGPMSRRLVEAGHKLTVFDTRKEAMEPLVKLGAEAARSPADVADRVETVLTSLPSLDIGMKVVSGDDGLIRGNRVRRYVDLSTTGSRAALKTAEILKQRNIVQIDSPVSGGVAGAEKGTLAVMVSGELEVKVLPRGHELAGAADIPVAEPAERADEAREVAAERSVDRLVHAHLCCHAADRTHLAPTT